MKEVMQMKTSYNKLINRILDYALERYGIK
jgi:hypothetical protein